MVFTTHILSILLLLLLPDNSPLFLHSFVPLRSLITENCSRAITVVANLKSQNGLGQKWFLWYQKEPWPGLFSWDLLCYLLTVKFLLVWSVTQSCLFAAQWIVAHQASLSMEFSRQEYWSGLPFPIPGDHPNPGIKPISLASPALTGRFFTTAPPGKLININRQNINIDMYTYTHQPLRKSSGYLCRTLGLDAVWKLLL